MGACSADKVSKSATGVKLQYTQFKYSWGAQENGYYLSFIGGVRMIVLLFLLPVLIKLFRKPPPLPSHARPDSPLDSPTDRSTPRQVEWEKEAEYLRVVHDSRAPSSLRIRRRAR